MKKCPFCAEEIQDEAVKCRHCGSDLGVSPAQTAATRTCPFCKKTDVAADANVCPYCMGDLFLQRKVCFVATATMGSPDDPAVVSLRELRDRLLIVHAPGRAFIQIYEAIGPLLAAIISPRPWMRWLSRFLLVWPAAAVSRVILSHRP